MRISDWSSDVCSSDLVDSSPLLTIAGDQAYRFECDIEIAPGGTAGLILFYDDRLYCGLGFDAQRFVTHQRSEEHTSELQSLMRISYAVFCLKKKTKPLQKYTVTKSNSQKSNKLL